MPIISPHDTLVVDAHVWTVASVAYGGEGTEDVIGLQVDGNTQDPSFGPTPIPVMFVPEILIRRAVEAGVATLHKASA